MNLTDSQYGLWSILKICGQLSGPIQMIWPLQKKIQSSSCHCPASIDVNFGELPGPELPNLVHLLDALGVDTHYSDDNYRYGTARASQLVHSNQLHRHTTQLPLIHRRVTWIRCGNDHKKKR